MKLSIVIPCYNEQSSIPELLFKCNKAVKASKDQIEFVIVNNGSTDETKLVINRNNPGTKNIKFFHIEKNSGYGNGILFGLTHCTGEIMGWTHADLQTDPIDVLAGHKILSDASDKNIFIKGSRKGRSFFDNFFTISMSIFESLLLGTYMWDINAQPTMFHRELYKKWKNPPNDFSLDLYAYYFAKINSCVIKKFPVYFGKRVYGTSHWNTGIKSKYNFIKRTLLYSFTLKKNLGKQIDTNST